MAVIADLQGAFAELQRQLSVDDLDGAQVSASRLNALLPTLPPATLLTSEDKAVMTDIAAQLPAILLRLKARRDSIGVLLAGLAQQ